MAAFYAEHKAFFDELAPLPEAIDEASVPFPTLPQTTPEKMQGLLIFGATLALALLAASYLSSCTQ